MAVNQKRTAIAAGAIAAAVVLIILIYGGLFYLMSGGLRSKVAALEKRVAGLEKQIADSGASNAAPSTGTQTSGQSGSESYEGWATYENKTVGYTIRHPDTWVAKEEFNEIDGKPVQYVIFTSPDGKYYVAIGLRRKSSETMITGRTEKAPGQMRDAGSITVLGIKVKRTEQVIKNQIKGYFYPDVGGFFEPGDYQGYAEFAKLTMASSEKYTIKGLAQTIVAEKIIKSLAVTTGETQSPDDNTAPAENVLPNGENPPAE